MSDSHDLKRFVDAQDPLYDRVVVELRAGRKTSHWMWFVFPQILGLAASEMSRRYAIRSLGEAQAYLAHPVLGGRLRECTGLVNAVADRSVQAIFGTPDDLKFQASATLFHEAAGAGPDRALFHTALQKYFGGERHAGTLSRLNSTDRAG